MSTIPTKILGSEGWQNVKRLFDECVDLPPEERKRKLDLETGNLPELRAEVEQLLEAYDRQAAADLLAEATASLAPDIAPVPEAPVPALLGRYRLIRRIGTGGMADVYLARLDGPAGFSKPLAIKKLHRTCSADPEFRGLFEYEAKLSSQLQHSNIVSVYEFDRVDGQDFLTMEYVSGKNLDQLLERLKAGGLSLPLPIAAYILGELCQALDYVHNKRDERTGVPWRLIHRDVTPRNIMISFDGQVKLLDFGIAKTVSRAKVTQSGLIRGTLKYIAPEIVEGQAPDHRSDLFSAAVVLRDLLASEKLSQPPGSEIGEMLAAVVQRGTEREPARRFQSAVDFQENLHLGSMPMGRAELRARLAELMKQTFPEGDEVITGASELLGPPGELEQVTGFMGKKTRHYTFYALFATALVIMLPVLGIFHMHGVVTRGPADIQVLGLKDSLRGFRFFAGSGDKNCTIRVESDPPGAKMEIDYKFYGGITPARVVVPCDRLTLVTLRKRGYEAEARAIRAQDSPPTLHLTLSHRGFFDFPVLVRSYWNLLLWSRGEWRDDTND